MYMREGACFNVCFSNGCNKSVNLKKYVYFNVWRRKKSW